MALDQLYYTSCEHGLSGFAGYQFNAVSAGASAETQREVLSQVAYKPPRSQMFPADAGELERCPVNLCFRPGRPSILANVEYVGQDFSKRFGNYFAHAFTAESDADLAAALGRMLPIELWRAPVWVTTQAATTGLSQYSDPLPRGVLSPAVVRDFLDGHPFAGRLPALLSAAAAAIEGRGRPVLLVESDSDRVARWIAAVSYLLPPRAGAALAFATYCADPSASRLHVVGTVPEALAELPLDVVDSFVLFDMLAAAPPDCAVHPLANLAVRVGVGPARMLWQTAATLAAPGTSGLDAWFGAATAAAALGRIELTAVEVAHAVAWAVEAGQVEMPVRARLASVLHDQPARSDSLLPALVELARRGGDQELCDEIRFEQIDAELARVRTSGFDESDDIRIGSPAIRPRIALRLQEMIDASTAEEALRLLAWARRAGLERDLEHVFLLEFSRRILVPAATNGDEASEALRTALREWPGVRRGFVAHLRALSTDDPDAVDQLLDGPFGRLLDTVDFDAELRAYPELLESVLISRARQANHRRVRVLLEILRQRGQELPDARLVWRLWHNWPWSTEELRTIALNVPLERLDDDDVALRFQGALKAVTDFRDIDACLGIAQSLLVSPAGQRLPAREALSRAIDFDRRCREVQTFADLRRVAYESASTGWLISRLAYRGVLETFPRVECEPSEVLWLLEQASPNVELGIIARIRLVAGPGRASSLKRVAGVFLRYARLAGSIRQDDVLKPLRTIIKDLRKGDWEYLARAVATADPGLADEFQDFEARYRKQFRLGSILPRGE